MDHKDKQELKRLFSQIECYRDKLQSISDKYKQEFENSLDKDNIPLYDYFDRATNHLYECYNELENIIDGI